MPLYGLRQHTVCAYEYVNFAGGEVLYNLFCLLRGSGA